MKNQSRLAILASGLLLGGASVFVAASAASVPLHPSPATPAASAQQQQAGEQQDANDTTDTSENQSGAQAEDAAGNAESQDPAGAQMGHQDTPGTPEQAGDNQD